eukprot:3995976-Amphidinium_carterae.1
MESKSCKEVVICFYIMDAPLAPLAGLPNLLASSFCGHRATPLAVPAEVAASKCENIQGTSSCNSPKQAFALLAMSASKSGFFAQVLTTRPIPVSSQAAHYNSKRRYNVAHTDHPSPFSQAVNQRLSLIHISEPTRPRLI